jgi:hypothetical protein
VDASRPAKALRTLAMLAAFLLLCAAAVVGILRKEKPEVAGEE